MTRAAKTKKTKISSRKSAASPASAFPDKAVIARSKDILWRENPDRSISILHTGNSDCVFLAEGISAQVFGLIDGNTRVQDIERRIIREHNPPLRQFRKDLHRFLAWLLKEQLISI